MHIAALKPRRQADAALLDEPNVDAGMAPSVTRQKVRQDALDRLRRRAYAQRPGLSLRERTRPLPEGFGIGQESTTALEQILSLRGQLETAPDSIEQRHAQLVLERVDLPGRGRLGHVQPAGRRRHAAAVRNRHEGAEMPKVHCENIRDSY